jgi:hypothetical protein
MERVDVNLDVKDRARFESAILHATIGLKHDMDFIDVLSSLGGRKKNSPKSLRDPLDAPKEQVADLRVGSHVNGFYAQKNFQTDL